PYWRDRESEDREETPLFSELPLRLSHQSLCTPRVRLEAMRSARESSAWQYREQFCPHHLLEPKAEYMEEAERSEYASEERREGCTVKLVRDILEESSRHASLMSSSVTPHRWRFTEYSDRFVPRPRMSFRRLHSSREFPYEKEENEENKRVFL